MQTPSATPFSGAQRLRIAGARAREQLGDGCLMRSGNHRTFPGWPGCASEFRTGGERLNRYFSVRQFTEARFSTVLDSIWMSKPLRSRYFSISTWPVPSNETP